ncbi:hypothetical protein Cob_v010312 [Colletotrichum orbiculare MAFF 240422]|uniref:Uncharacterized protein n=1 Tax=Colletotrichum orbiculare (strain 104-T / ATCC 96160 / CBS 514.97 / LARS 414 / MAFF 240422) TaxID=1213857 RepID=A0A484FFI7_COLOR|nr:hypothetical protein Cob_v010312 [Colletotrichum orbiculare MAFF 240422]
MRAAPHDQLPSAALPSDPATETYTFSTLSVQIAIAIISDTTASHLVWEYVAHAIVATAREASEARETKNS